ncbi:hypothetical protein HYPSUDRAFT_80504 [Hypholoma sublateritium FD-334 SS-4]|uniref:Mid2 domain-containing protein n=1 Tax=Hypholoma sublateritium (strain FD-334 SS-4) TaxID=945553 RepID=A0A0D2LX65_HYPSF|nr:hypothetical protein HYPSUDRAFT_80504 [Hypholoma sublateritium FD-334 SS-4]
MSRLSLSFLIEAILFSFLLATQTSADINPYLFRWVFGNGNNNLTQLATCGSNLISIVPINGTVPPMGVPPYYMISYAVGQMPVTSFMGEDPQNLVFAVTQPPGKLSSRQPGSQLLLSVVDSLGNPGGSPPQLITVIEGQTTQCVTWPSSEPSFTVSANASENLDACAPWAITASGGSPPYTITLSETGEPFVINVTMPFGADRYTYINRATSGGQLIAAVSDFTGRWASGTPVISPIGSSDNNCNGVPSSSTNATLIDKQAAISRQKHKVTVIVVVVLLLVAGPGGYTAWTLRRCRQRRREAMKATVPAQFPRTYEEPTDEYISRGKPQKAPEPRRWRVRADAEESAARRNVEAPVHRGPLAATLRTPAAPANPGDIAVGLFDGTSSPPVQVLDDGAECASWSEHADGAFVEV